MKRKMAFVMVMLLIVGVISGCGSSGGTVDKESNTAAETEAVSETTDRKSVV